MSEADVEQAQAQRSSTFQPYHQAFEFQAIKFVYQVLHHTCALKTHLNSLPYVLPRAMWVALQEEITINICLVSNNKQEELIAKWQQSQFRHTQKKKTGIALCL